MLVERRRVLGVSALIVHLSLILGPTQYLLLCLLERIVNDCLFLNLDLILRWIETRFDLLEQLQLLVENVFLLCLLRLLFGDCV